MPDNEEVQKALQVLQSYAVQRGDSFDIGTEDEPTDYPVNSSNIIEVLNNPRALADSLNLTERQAENLRSLIVGGGTGSVHKLLNRYIGDQPAAMVGALLSGWLAQKMFK